MSNLKKKKYFALLGIVVIVLGLIGLFTLGKVDKYRGLVKVKNVVSKTSSLSASVSNLVDSPSTSKGTDEIKYNITYTLDEVAGVEKRDVIILGSLSGTEGKYARFKEITGSNITSTLSDNGKSILVRIEDITLGEEQNIALKLVITNAPNGFKVTPNIKIKEATGEETNVTVNEVEVQTNSMEGIVKDEKGLPVSNIELSLNDEHGEVKRTYTDEDGRYVFSDIENKTYTVKVEEEIYIKVSEKKVDGRLDINIKQVSPYEIEAHKYITKLDLVINGKEEHYTYNDLETVVQAVKNAKTISGQITYKITVKNIGEKEGRLSKLNDIVDEGLSFNKDKNIGWKEKNGKLYYELIEESTIKPKETKEITLKLDIKETNQIKTYINKIDVKGEAYENVVYILNGRKYREETVVLGERLVEPVITAQGFTGWYTDKNFTNKYNFKNEVTKDLILYGKTEVIKHNVEFYDKDPRTHTETKWDEQEVEDGDKATEPTSPEHRGYEFECWMDEHDNIWDFDNEVTRDLRLTSCYSVIEYKITYHGLTPAEEEGLQNPKKYTIEDTFTLNNPANRSDNLGDLEAFVGWTGSNGDNPSTTVTVTDSIGDLEFTANFVEVLPDEYTIIYNLDNGEYDEGVDNPRTYTKRSETFTLNNPHKDHYTFTGWTGTGLTEETETVTIPQGSEGNREYTAHYTPTMRNVTFNDYDVESETPDSTVVQFGDTVSVQDGNTVNPPATNPEHTGYTCDKWSTKINGDYNTDAYNFSTPVEDDLTLYTLCKKKNYTVTYMDGDTLYGTDTVPYKEKTTKPSQDPTKAHHIFKVWTLNGEAFDFETPITDNITLYSSYEEVLAPVITHSPTEWTNQNVTVTVSKNASLETDTGYSYKYKIADGDYQNYEGPFEVEENCTVYAVAYKNTVPSTETDHIIDNIDKIKPTINSLAKTSNTQTTAVVEFSSTDNESGVKEHRVYLDEEYVGTLSYTGGPHNQSDTYELSELTPGQTYTVKLLTVDVAGNISDAAELEITTDDRIVCQIIGRNNQLYNDETLNEPFSTLRGAIESCGQNQCTIQMLESVNETNDVLEGQDITLDLNGKNVSGVRDYTLDINGDFILIDNGTTSGMIYNSIDSAVKIEDGGKFTMGINELLNPEVSTSIPYVYGKYFGVKRLEGATYNFYDGAVRGEVAISGEVDDAPYMYTASVRSYDDESTPYQVATLMILDDAEARIKTKYYTRVATAVAEAKKGYYDNLIEDTTLDENFKKTGDYGFVKNEQGILVNENNERYTIAKSQYSISLVDSDEDKDFVVSTIKVSDNPSDDYSDIIITEYLPAASEDSANNQNTYKGYTINLQEGEETHNIYLKKGHLYTIEFQQRIYSNTPENSKLYITEAYLKNVETDPVDSSIDKEGVTNYTKQYGFDYDETTGTYTSNNNYEKGTTAFSFIEFDLTSETTDKLLTMRASYDGMYSGDYGNVIVKTNNTIETYSNSSGLVYIYAYNSNRRNFVGPYSYMTKLEAGKKYYVQFYYFKSSGSYDKAAYDATGCKDEFKIYDIRLSNYDIVSTTQTQINLNTEEGNAKLIKNSEYGYDNRWNNYYPKGKTPDMYDAALIDSYMKFDLTNSSTGKTIDLNSYGYSCYNTDVGCKFYAVVTDSVETPTTSDGAFISRENNNLLVSGKGVIEPGKVNYVHFVFDKPVNQGEPGGNYASSYVYLQRVNINDGIDYNLVNYLKTEGEYGWTASNNTRNNNTTSATSGTTAHSYIKVDLTNSTSPEYLIVNTYGYADYAILVNNSKNEPSSRDGAQFTNTDGTYFSGDKIINLTPGQVNYVHFLSTNYNNNYVNISSIKRYSGEILDLSTQLKKSPNVSKGFTYDNSYYYSPGNMNANETADSYIEFDLTNATKDKVVDAYMYLYTSNNFKYVYLSNSPKAASYNAIANDKSNLLIFYSNSITYYYYNNGTNLSSIDSHYNFVLPKGNKYYLHFATNSTSSTSYDYLKIRSVTLFDTDDSDFRTGLIPYYDTASLPDEVILPGDMNIDPANDNNFRFIGRTPNNYISFNNELWRIIGIFETDDGNGNLDKRLKITKDNSYGGYIYDSTPYNANGPINGGYGINEWSQADLMKLLNPGFEENEEETFTYDSTSDTYTSDGVNRVNNSLYWNSGSGKCFRGQYNQTMDCNFSSGGLTSAAKSFIDTVVWYTGAIPYNTNISPYSIYSYERGNATTKSGIYDTVGVDDTVTRTVRWTGKVGVPYVSDYLMATGDFYSSGSLIYTREQCLSMETSAYGACTSNADWMSSNGSPMTVMNPIFGQNASGSNSQLSFVAYPSTVYGGGMPASSINYQIKPTVYLKTNTYITGGDGSYSTPYTIELKETKNPDSYYGLVPSSGGESEENIINQETETDDWDKVKNNPTYGFVYDSENDIYINDNIDIPKSTASSYVEIDLTGEVEDKELSVSFDLSTYSAGGYLILMESPFKDINYSSFSGRGKTNECEYYQSSMNGTNSVIFNLEHGKKYYLQMIYKKSTEYGVTDDYSDTMKVKMNIMADTIHTTEIKSYDGRVPVLNEEVDTVQILKDISLTSSLNIEATKDMILDLNGYTLTTTANDYVIKNNGSLKVIDTGYDRDMAMAEAQYNVDMNNYNIQKQEYIASVAQDKTDREAAMATYNQRSYEADGLMINLSSKEYGETENTWEDLSGNNNNQTIDDTKIDETTKAYKNQMSIQNIAENNNTITYEVVVKNVSGAGGFFTELNNIWSAYHANNKRLTVNFNSRSDTNPDALTYVENNSFTFTFVKTNSTVKIYINGKLVDTLTVISSGSQSYQSIHQSDIYGFRAYNRALTDAEIKHNFDVDNGLYNIETIDGTALMNYTFTGAAGNDLISELQSTVWNRQRNDYTLGDSTSTVLGDVKIVRSTYAYPFYTDFSRIKVNITKEDYTGQLYIGLAKTLPSTPANTNINLSIYDSYISVPENETASTKDFILKPTTYGDYFLVVMSNKGFIIHEANFDVEVPVKNSVSYTGSIINSTRNGIYNEKGAFLDVDQGILYNDTTSYVSISNYGTLTLGDHAVVDGKGTGIINYSTGDILDGTGTFGKILAIENRSTVDDGFGGYKGSTQGITGVGSSIQHNSTHDITISNVDVFDVVNNSSGKVTVTDSIVRSVNNTTSSNTGSIDLNNTQAQDYTLTFGTGSIKDSTVEREVTSQNGAIISSDNSTVGRFRGNYTNNNYKSLKEDIRANDTNITCFASSGPFGSVDYVTITGYFNLGTSCSENAGAYATEILTLGKNDETVDTSQPKMNSINAPLINFYDGQTKTFGEKVNDIPEGYEIVQIKNSDNEDVYTLGNDEVAQIGTTKYNSLSAAIAAVTDNTPTTITVLKDISNVRDLTISENQNITIDYNGHSVDSYGNTLYTIDGVLTLDDLSGEPKQSKIKGNFVVNTGEFNYNNVKYASSSDSSSRVLVNSGTVNFESGELTSSYATVSNVVYKNIVNTGELNISGTDVKVYIYNSSEGEVLYEDGVTTQPIVNDGSLTITGGSLTGNTITNNNTLLIDGLVNDYYFIVENKAGTGTIINSNARSQILASGGTFTVKDSTIPNATTAIALTNDSVLTLDNSTIDNNTSSDAITIANTATLNIINNSVIKDSDNHTTSGTGITISYSGNLNFKSGSVHRIRGIVNSGNGTMIFGEEGGEVSKTNPSIKGSNNGFRNTNNSSTVYFYDGIFTGPVNGSLVSVITATETGYEPITIDDPLGESKILSGDPLVKNTRSTVEYDNLQQAINESQSGDTLEFLRDLTTLTSYPTVTVDSTKDVIVDTKGKNIIYNGTSGYFINNSGKIKFTDSDGSSIITDNSSHALFNNNSGGDMEVDNFDISLIHGSIINNAGTATVSDIALSTTSSPFGTNSGTMTVSDSTYNDALKIQNGFFITNTGTLELNNNTFVVQNSELYSGSYLKYDPTLLSNSGNVNIVDGTYNGLNTRAIYTSDGLISLNQNSGTLKVQGSIDMGSNSSIVQNGGTVTYNSSNEKLSIDGSSIYTINDGTITHVAEVKSNGTFNIYGGTLNIYNGIGAESNTTINVGIKDDDVDVTSPIINNTIRSLGQVNIYNGKIKSYFISANDINVEDNSTLCYDGTWSYLTYDKIIKNVEQNKEYVDIQQAINEAGSGETLQLINGAAIDIIDQLTIPSGKNIIFDINNQSIYTNLEDLITNNGQLEITNSGNSYNAFQVNKPGDEVFNIITNNNDLKISGKVRISGKITNTNNHQLEIDLANIDSYASISTVDNSGTFVLTKGYINKINNKKNTTMNGGKFNNLSNTNSGNLIINDGNIGFITNSSVTTINGGTITGGTTSERKINSTGTLNINNVSCSSCANLIEGSSNINISGGTYNINRGYVVTTSSYSRARVNITGGTFTDTFYTNPQIINSTYQSDVINIKDITTTIPIGTMSGTLYLENVDVNSNYGYEVLKINSGGITHIADDVSLISSTKEAINNSGRVNLGTKDGTVKINTPVIKGETTGLINNTGSSFYYYDGIISGKTSAISGVVTETETDYSVKITDDGTYKNAILKTTGDIEKVVVVNNVNYDTIQAAVNAVPDNVTTNMILYTNYTLTDNITVPANKTIEFYNNGFTINYNGFAFNGEGTINFHSGLPSGAGGAIYRFLASLTGTEINPKNIIIYQMDNGMELSPAENYKLYKVMDGELKLVNVDEEEIGEYSIGHDKSILRTTTGQIKINGIGEGTYRLSGSDGSELDFNIDENGVSNNIRENRYQSLSKKSVTAVATLILQLQTGVIRNPYILTIMILIVLAVGFIVYKKYKEGLK